MLNPIDDPIESAPVADTDLSGPATLTKALIRGELGDPFALLGPHDCGSRTVLRVFAPPAQEITALDRHGGVLASLEPMPAPGLFAGWLPRDAPYVLRIRWPNGDMQETEDPYSFGLLLGELDVYLLAEGNHLELGRCLGAQCLSIDGVAGVRFAVWAPNARRVSVVGNFNGWDGRQHVMRKRLEAGVWELFIPRLPIGSLYKYEILGPQALLPL